MTLVLPEIGCKALECVFMVRQIHTTEKKKPSMQLLVERADHVWALLENAS